jgi:hypothetical protein
MFKLAMIVAVVAACGGGGSKPAESPREPAAVSNTEPTPAPAPQTPIQEAMAKMREFSDKMCACKDSPCAQAVSDEMTKWAQEMANQTEPVKMTEEDQKAATEIGARMGECMQKAMSAGGTTP